MVVAQAEATQVARTGSSLVPPTYRWPHAPHGATRQPQAAGTPPRPARRIEVRELTARDVMAAARLLALRHQRARESSPELPAHYQSARPWFIELARGFERKRGVVATDGGEIVGFMLAEQGTIGDAVVTQSAVATGSNAASVYAEMCAALREQQ